MRSRSFRAASRIANPLMIVPRDATVGPLSGTRDVSTVAMWTCSIGTCNASDAT